MSDPADRVVSLDLIRGIAVLGILAVNIAGFAGPSASSLTPHVPLPASALDETVFAGIFVLFEGKMRALFTVLFGASLLLFIERAEANGRDGEVLQLRRLGWLLVFGMLHYFLFWWGDILFIYAMTGILALFMRDLPTRPMLIAAVVIFIAWHLGGLIGSLPDLRAEEHVRLAMASAGEAKDHAEFLAAFHERAVDELAEYRLGFSDQVGIKLSERPLWLIETTFPNLGETLPLVLIGMTLLRSGFFAGEWQRRRMVTLAATSGAVGLALTLAMLGWLWERHFPPRAMSIALLYATALPHLLMALAYAALLVLAAPLLAPTWLGKRLIAAGRMAFTNYIATTVLMTAIFYGWGLGLVGTVGHAGQIGFVALGWVLMLGWSQPWLARFRQGPLEWLWRSLTELRLLPMRRRAAKLSENHLQ